MSGRWPAIVQEIDRGRREVRVEIPGVTDGAEELPIAEIEYPIGDKSEHTEIRFVVGDRVWVDFINGDPRWPIITGFRTKHTGNEVGWRRWHHDNIESEADTDQTHGAGNDFAMSAGSDFGIDAGNDFGVDAGNNAELVAGTKILHKVGGATIEITSSKITLSVAGQTLEMSASGFALNGTMFTWN